MTNQSLTILGILVIFVATSLGAATVYVMKNNISGKTNSIVLGFASGVMIAASFFGLINPSIEQSETILIPVIGMLLGVALLVSIDHIVPHIHGNMEEEGPKSSLKKEYKMLLAVTIHNIPEGLAVGISFGNASLIGTHGAYLAAMSLAIGIAIQNFPEGLAVSLPFRKNYSKNKSFYYGVLSGVVEPIFAVLGLYLSTAISSLMPAFLSFAAGAMLYVTIEDLLPEAGASHTNHTAALSFIFGFIIMMILDVTLG